MGTPSDGSLIITPHLLDEHGADLYERFVRMAEKYQYRDLGGAAADAIRAWVETHERSDTGRPPPNPDATLEASAPSIDDADGPPTSRS